jgi:hypothetical protein
MQGLPQVLQARGLLKDLQRVSAESMRGLRFILKVGRQRNRRKYNLKSILKFQKGEIPRAFFCKGLTGYNYRLVFWPG